jgi:SAM-dependent methyltransferase
MGVTWLPWWGRIAAKVILARLPIDYTLWKRFGLFQHGDMNLPARALETCLMHAKTVGISTSPNIFGKNFTVLELGPGDSVFTALVAKAIGAEQVWLVDAGPYATTEPAQYTAMADYLKSQGFSLPFATTFKSLQEVLTVCNSIYLTDGVTSLMQIPDQSIDFCFSNAVLEHIPKRDFPRLAIELKRVLRPGGVCVHRVDLQDHLGGGLENLRFSDSRWEGELFSRSGFYTNRIRYTEMLNIFKQAGFNCQTTRKITWDVLPIARNALAIEFQQLTNEELLVRGFDVVLRHDENALVASS